MLATAGSAIGLGNIWKLPYMIGVNGGSAFVLLFIACIFLVGIPLMMTEIMLGRAGQQNPFNAIESLAKTSGHNRQWRWIGAMGMLAGALILSFYSVIGGWVLHYMTAAAESEFTHIQASQAQVQFSNFLANPLALIFWQTMFMLLVMTVVANGVNAGLERANNIMIPLLFIILLILLGYSMSVGDMSQATRFMFQPDFSKLTSMAVLSAMGHAFFSLSLGMGSVMVYGSYLTRDVSIARTTIYIALADTMLGLLVGLAIYALVFANKLPPAAGPGLIFQTLPIAFGNMPAGNLIATLFFLLVAFAAWTSAISLVEPTIAWIVENTTISRAAACAGLGAAIWLLGISVVLSFNVWQDVTVVFGLGIFDTLDKLTSTIMLPLGGLLMALFAGYCMSNTRLKHELGIDAAGFLLWRIANRFVAPLAIAAVFLFLFGFIK